MNTLMICCAAAIAATIGTSTLLAQDTMSKPMGMEKEKAYTAAPWLRSPRRQK